MTKIECDRHLTGGGSWDPFGAGGVCMDELPPLISGTMLSYSSSCRSILCHMIIWNHIACAKTIKHVAWTARINHIA